VVGDPSHLARWWPKVERVEGVGRGAFTQVMKTKKGRNVRADFHVVDADRPRLHSWAQDLVGTPFERFLALNETTIELEPVDAGTRVTITARQKLRGLSRIGGGFMLKRATTKQLDEALDGLERVS
jgi:carbon monoxide dehydrogenase subunit G